VLTERSLLLSSTLPLIAAVSLLSGPVITSRHCEVSVPLIGLCIGATQSPTQAPATSSAQPEQSPQASTTPSSAPTEQPAQSTSITPSAAAVGASEGAPPASSPQTKTGDSTVYEAAPDSSPAPQTTIPMLPITGTATSPQKSSNPPSELAPAGTLAMSSTAEQSGEAVKENPLNLVYIGTIFVHLGIVFLWLGLFYVPSRLSRRKASHLKKQAMFKGDRQPRHLSQR